MTAPLDRLTTALGDRYALERQVGEGGMATVYLARDLKHARKVAIKVLRPELSVSLGADRFLREIRVAANLQHPNILALYDSGEVDGLLYYVMPFVEGESLRDRLNREQQLPLHDALQITREAAEALAHAHQHGIVHRDIKPENILLLDGHALVADFGIARAVTSAGGERLTQTGTAIGTPYYMSPEQSHGSDHVDVRSDIYSLGCVLYELLIGQPPFTGPNAVAIMARHAMEVVPSLQVVRPAVPDDVEDAVLQALQKTPADRYQTMREFAEALVSAEAETTITRTAARRSAAQARRIPTRELAAATPRAPARDRRILIGSGVLALLLLAGGAWAVLRHRVAGPAAISGVGGLDPHRVAVLYFQDLDPRDSLGYLADGLTEGLIRQLAEVQTLDVISPNGVAPYRGDSVPRDSVARALKVGTLVQGGVEKDGGRIRVTVRLIDGASGADYKRASFEQPAANLLRIQDSLVQQVTELIRQRLGEEIRVREQRESTASPQAWLLVQRAQETRKRAEAVLAQDAGGAARSFDEADSLYALAQAADATLGRAAGRPGHPGVPPVADRRAGPAGRQGLDRQGCEVRGRRACAQVRRIRMRSKPAARCVTGDGCCASSPIRWPRSSSSRMRNPISRGRPRCGRRRLAPGPSSATCTIRPAERPTPSSRPGGRTRRTRTSAMPTRCSHACSLPPTTWSSSWTRCTGARKGSAASRETFSS